MKLPSSKVTVAMGGSLALVALTLIISQTIGAHHTVRPKTPTNQSIASPAQLAADEAAYRASDALMTQLCNTYDQDKQAEQTALDTYGDASEQYQAAKAVADKAYDACKNQMKDATSKSLQVTIDGGTPSN